MKKRQFLIWLVITALVLAIPGGLLASSNGISGFSGEGGATCNTCHMGGVAPTVTLTGPTLVAPNSNNTYTLTISGGQQVAGGLGVSTTAGTLAASDPGTKILNAEVVQSAPRNADGNGDVIFTFDLTAPPSGTLTLYAAGNSVNGANAAQGDLAAATSLLVTVEEEGNQPPVSDPNGPYSASPSEMIQFDGSGSTDPDGTIVSYDWDFGDSNSGSGMSPTHSYAMAGSYTVSLTVTDNEGATDTAATTATISDIVNQPPSADPDGPYSASVNEMIQFDGSGSTDPDGTIVSYDWDFGDGNAGTGMSPTHSYAMAGTYVVSLTVTDDKGATDTDSTTATIGDEPPTGELTPMEKLGKALFFDKNLSTPKGQACAVCHAPESGWTGPDPEINAHGAVYEGAKKNRFGNRKPPSSAYATPSPIFHKTNGEFMGGNFWDGRATGDKLGNPAADQAQGPFLNPLEQANHSEKVVCKRVKQSKFAKKLFGQSYEELFTEAFGPGSFDCKKKNVAATYDRIALAIAAYEGSSESNQYSSKYDAWLKGMAELTDQEMMGFGLFTGKALCSACHLVTPGPNGEPPLFTDFKYHNLGAPKNPENPFYTQHKKFNPDGADWIDPGLGGFLSTQPDYKEFAEVNYGKHKTPTLRNVDKRPYPSFVKAFGHNGVFKSIEEIVHFYNTRDVPGMWPPPEVAANLSPLLGNLGLSAEEEAALVAFMKTLSDADMDPPDVNDKWFDSDSDSDIDSDDYDSDSDGDDSDRRYRKSRR